MRNSRSALTLLELLLIIVILSVFLGISLPSMRNNVRNMSFRSFTNKVYLLFDYAKTNSVLTNRVLKVNFDSENSTLVLSEKVSESEIIKSIDVPSEYGLESENDQILFFPDGTLQEFTLSIHDDRQHRTTISSEGFNEKIVISSKDD